LPNDQLSAAVSTTQLGLDRLAGRPEHLDLNEIVACVVSGRAEAQRDVERR
jgi:hypothetical protein